MRTIPASELIINNDGSIFHLHLLPEQLADTVILVGDPGRVALVSGIFRHQRMRSRQPRIQDRDGHLQGKTHDGTFDGHRHRQHRHLASRSWTRWPTSISPPGRRRPQKRQLTLVRLGTSGAIQPDIKVGEFVFSRTSVRLRRPAELLQGPRRGLRPRARRGVHGARGWNELLPQAPTSSTPTRRCSNTSAT